MSNNKRNKNILFKICTIILLIILSTICVFSTKVKADDLYRTGAYEGSLLPRPLDALDGDGRVLCSQQGTYLNNFEGLNSNGKKYSGKYCIEEYVDQTATYSTTDARIKYILALTGKDSGNHKFRPTQQAWWALIGLGTNMGSGGSGNSGWNSDSISAGMSIVNNMFNNPNPNMVKDIQEIVADSSKSDAQKKKDIKKILKDVYGEAYTDEEYEEDAQAYLDYKVVEYTPEQIQELNNAIYDDTPENIIKDLKSKMTGSLAEANDFANYTTACLTKNGTKLNMTPALNTDKLSEVAFKVEKDDDGKIISQSYALGNLSMVYPYCKVGSSGLRFSGICGLHLNVKLKNEEGKELEYVGVNKKLETLKDYQYTIYAQDFSGAYPESGKDFTIMVKYSEDIDKFLDFSFDYYYVTSSETATYAYHTLSCYQHTYSKKVSRTRTTEVKDSNGNWNTVYGTAQTDTQKYDPVNGSTKDAFSNSNYYSYWTGNDGNAYRYYYGSLVEGAETETITFQDLQDLSTTISSSLYINFGTCSMKFLQEGKTITIHKILEDKNENQIDNLTGKSWNFAVYIEKGKNDDREYKNKKVVDGTEYIPYKNDIVVTGNTSETVELPPYYPDNYGTDEGGRAPKVLIIETDQYGNSYEDWTTSGKVTEKEQLLYSAWHNATPKENMGMHVLNADEYEFTDVNVIDLHSHLRIDKKVPEDGFSGEETFNILLKLTNGDQTTEHNLELTPSRETRFIDVNFDGLTGQIMTGVENGYVFARFESNRIDWKTTKAPEYWMMEVLTQDQDLRYNEPVYPAGNSGTLKDCKNCESNQEPIFTSSSIINRPKDNQFKVDVDVTKYLLNTKGEESKNTTLLEKNYQISIAVVKADANNKYDLINLMEPETFFIQPVNSDLTEYNTASYKKEFYLAQDDNSQYAVIIDEEDSEGTFFKDFEATLGNSEESDYDNWTIVRKENSNEIDYIIREIDTINKGSSFNCDVKVYNETEDYYTAVVLQKTFANGTPSPDTKFYFAVHANTEKSFIDELFDDDVFLKDDDGNYVTTEKDGVKYERIVTVTKTLTGEEFKTISNVIDYINGMTMDILEVDQYGEAYSENPSNGDSVWKTYKPTDGVGLIDNYEFIKFKENAGEIKDDSITASIENHIKDEYVNVLIKKRLLSFGENEEDVSEEIINERLERFFEENPNFTFKFKVYAGLNINHTTQFKDITKEYFGVDKIEIGKDLKDEAGVNLYKAGVKSKDISLKEYNGKFYVRELFDSEEDKNLFIAMNGDNNDFVWYFTVPAGVTGTVEFDADNGLTKLRIDKNIKPFLDGEEFYFKVWEGKEDVTEKYFGVDTIVVDKTAHDNGGVTSEDDIYGNHTFKIVEYDDKGYTWDDRAKSDSDYWDLYKPEGNGTWTYDTNSIKPDENAIKLIEAKNYYNGGIEIKKESKSENIPNSEKDKIFKATLVVTPQPDSELYINDKLQLEPYSDTVELKIGESKVFDNISWYGNAPKYTVTEVEIPDGWKLEGFDINGNETETFTEQEMIEGKNANSVVIKNTYVSDAEILINKTLVNQNNQPVTLRKDETFYFNVYVSGKGIEYNGKESVDYEKLTLLTTLDVTLKAGTPQANVSTGTIKFTSDELKYKVVEVDQYNVSLDDYNDKGTKAYNSEEDYKNSYWKIYDNKGPWEGTLKNKDSKVITINADNYLTTVTADFKKFVIDENGKTSKIADKETFIYKYEFTSNKNTDNNRDGNFVLFRLDTSPNHSITHDTEQFETFILEKGEKISYTITEVDSQGRTYENRGDSQFWKEFVPTNGTGIETGTFDGSRIKVELDGTNQRIKRKIVHDKLQIVKIVAGQENDDSRFRQGEEFNFIVNDGNHDLTTAELKDLFPDFDGKIENNKIVLDYDNQSALSRDIEWDSRESAPIYTITEVDNEGKTYIENPNSDFWKKYTPDDNGIHKVQLTAHDLDVKISEENINIVSTSIQINRTGYSFTFIKKLKGTVYDNEENFYFRVEDLNQNNKVLTKQELDELFGEGQGKEIDGISDPVLVIDENNYEKGISTIINVKEDQSYKIVELDNEGKTYIENPNSDFWKKYTPDNNGEWIVKYNGTSKLVITAYNEGTIPYSADIYVLKQCINSDGWKDEEKTYTIDVYIMRGKEDGTYQSKEEAEVITANLTYKNPSEHVKHVEWKAGEKAPMVYFEEVGYNGDKSYEINGTETTDNTIILQNGYNVKDTLRCNNGKGGGDKKIYKNGNIGVKKTVNGHESDAVYTFRYQISRDSGNTWDSKEGYELQVKADGNLVQPSSKVTWESTEPTPMFRIWEDNNDSLEFITSDDLEGLTPIKDDSGKVIGYQGEYKDNAVITFKANNQNNTSGGIRVIKKFENLLEKDMSIDAIMKELEKVAPNTQFYFKLTITGNFTYNETPYTTDNPLVLEKTYKIADFSKEDLQNGKDIFGEVKVEWNSESKTPEFAVSETTSGSKFWNGTWIDKTSSALIADETVEVKMTNEFNTKYPELTPYIQLGGLVWKDELETDKTELTATNGIVGDGKYDASEELLSNVYVVPVRIVKYANGDIKKYNNTQSKFLNGISGYYYYITESDIKIDVEDEINVNTWHFDDVQVPAATKEELEAGVTSVKYDIYFYYDGTKYSPTKLLEHADTYGDNYISLADAYMNNFEDSKFFVDSMAIEGDPKERSNKMSRFATVEGDSKFNSNEHTTQGKVLDSNGDFTSEVDYEMTSNSNIDENLQEYTTTDPFLVKYTSEGEVRLLKDNAGINSKFEDYFVRATTGEAGLTYLFTDSFVISDEDFIAQPSFANSDEKLARRITPEYIEYYYPDGEDRYLATYPYAKHINLGLIERPKAATTLTKTIDSVTMVVNDKTANYKINNGNKEEVLEGIMSCVKKIAQGSEIDNELFKLVAQGNQESIKEFNVYTSDYYYRADAYKGTDAGDALAKFYNAINGTNNGIDAINSRNLQIYLTYKLHVYNASGDYDVVVNSIDDYYNSDLEFVDTVSGYNYMGGSNVPGPGIWAYIEQEQKEETGLTNILADNSEYYAKDSSITGNEFYSSDSGVSTHKKLTIDWNNNKDRKLHINAQDSKDLYLTYKVVKLDEFTKNLFKTGVKENVAEISSFTTYLSKGEQDHDYKYYAGVLDSMSAPGSYNIVGAPDWMEMDTDRARIDIRAGKEDITRTVSGTAWLDADNENNAFNGQTLGDSKLGDLSGDSDKAISGLKAQLVEIIDVPKVVKNDDNTFTITNDYTEYEYYWDNAEAVTNSEGKYTINQYAPHGIVNHGLVAGNYAVRFVYGDHNTVDNTVALNGEDYKTTAYQVENSSELDSYIDNEWLDFDNMLKDENQARDNEARRLYLIKQTQELDNNNTSIFDVAEKSKADYVQEKQNDYDQLDLEDTIYPDYGADYDYYESKLYGKLDYDKNGSIALNEEGNEIGIIKADGYAMFADTAKMNIKLEKLTDKDNIAGYDYDGVNIGIEERSNTNIYVDKQIKEISLTNPSKTFFHIEYDIDYKYSETQPTSDNEEYPYFKVDDNLWVRLIPEKVEGDGVSNLQALNDVFNSNRTVTQGFRYINIDPSLLHGVDLDIKYQFTAFNFSETDTYGEKLDNIMYDNSGKEYSMDDRAKNFDAQIKFLAEANYQLDTNTNNTLNFAGTGYPKKFGQFLGHTYYQGFNTSGAWTEDKVVTTTIRKMIDYVDNDIEINQVINTGAENGHMWNSSNNSYDELGNMLDDHIFVEGKVKNDSESEYKNIYITTDSKDFNSNFVKRLDPLGAAVDNNNFDTATVTTISESKEFTGQDKGNTGIDNFAEILMIENTVGRRDKKTVYGNYDPRAGAEYTTERDESSTEIVTLSPPTGNAENERNMTIAFGAIVAIAILAGGATGIKLKLSKKAKKSEEDEDKKAE